MKKNIIPLDLDSFNHGSTDRVTCINSHVLNITFTHLKNIQDFSKKYGCLLAVPYAIPELFMIPLHILQLRDQIDAVDFCSTTIEDKELLFTDNLDGMDVLATNDGTVVTIINDGNFTQYGDSNYSVPDNERNNLDAFGNAVIIEHEDGSYFSAYAHLQDNSIKVQVGESVKRGQFIGRVGTTGNSSNSHLHFELFYNNRFLGAIPKRRTDFEIKELTLLNDDAIATFESPLKKYEDDKLPWFCFLTETPKLVTESLGIYVAEAAKKPKLSKATNFKEFCDECKTPEEAMKWFINNRVDWYSKEEENRIKKLKNKLKGKNDLRLSPKIVWPDDLIRTRAGICFDQSVCMHMFFKKRKIEHRLAYFIITSENGAQFAHVYPIYKKGKYYYCWSYFAPGMGCINGPYHDYYEAAQSMTQYYKVNMLGSPKLDFPIMDMDYSIQNYEETELIEKYIGQDLTQSEYMLKERGATLYSTPYWSRDLHYIRIPRPQYLLLKLAALAKETQDKIKEEELKEIQKESVSILTEDTKMSLENQGIVNTVLNILGDNIDMKKFSDLKTGKKFMFTRCKVMNKFIPLVLFLSYCEGLTTVLRKAGVKFSFSDTRPRLQGYDAVNNGIIKFADGYLIYEKFPLEISLLMNGMAIFDTSVFTYSEMDEKMTYVGLFEQLFGTRALSTSLGNFYDWMIDPVTYQILEDLNYPTDFVSLMLAGNKLLADNNFRNELDMENWRIRKNEMVYAHAYKAISHAYSKFKSTSNNKNPDKISIAQSTVMTNISQSEIVEDVSELSPIVEFEKDHLITDKGPSGTNLKEAYTMKRRCYHASMMGVMGITSSPDANVGINRTLVVEPNVINGRGYVKDYDSRDMNECNIFGGAELLTPWLASNDDPVRASMGVKQSKHIIPVESASPVLVSNGMEKVLPYHLSNDFCVVAKNDGKVIFRNDKTGVIIIEYKDKTKQIINMNSKVVKNGAGGFFLTNQFNVDKLQKGASFKKNEVLAYNTRFFSGNKYEGVRFNIGVLTKVACCATYISFEDGNFITEKLSKRLGTTICMESTAIVGANSNVSFIVKKGQEIRVDDPLIIYDDSSNDASFNKMLDNIGKELKEEITGMGKVPIKSHYSGIVEDIKLYSTVKPKDMSPSLRKIVEAYYSEINAQQNDINKNTKGDYIPSLAFTETSEIIEDENGKIMGNKVGEGVLFKFYIKYLDNMDIGDKLVHFTAMKYVNAELIKKGEEPYSLDRPEEEVSSCFSPAGVLARMTPSIFRTMYANKVIVELKRKWLELYKKDNPKFEPKEDLY